MNPQDDSWDEERLAALFASADSNAAPPDQEFLDRLRQRSTEVFAAEFSQQTPVPQRRRRMFFLSLRMLAASVAAAIVIAAGVWSLVSPADSQAAFGTVLEKVAAAETLHLEITRQGQSSHVWTRQPQQLRWNHPDGTYRIARGRRLWLIDEKANRATSQASPYFGGEPSGLDPLALLDLPARQDRQGLLGQRPVERVQRDGRPCDVYRMQLPSAQGKVEIEALVDAGTQRLRWLVTRAHREGRLEPIAKLTVLAVNEPVDEDLFVVGDTLTEDGRIGKVTDVLGIVSVKPVMHRRWTPVAAQMLLKPGDWVRTDVRGANAALLRLVKQTHVTLGPGSLVELVRPDQIRMLAGELKIAAGAKAPLELIGPGEQKVQVKGKQLYRLDREKLVRVDKDPLWLKGFEGTTANESIGSLVAKVEGRDVPLTVGYHKVSVDIRDQIARTVIEESFVNHTDNRLEGVFYFPLPQDASISGFGMWIGDQLVEADVVEKQRAREIYETILRERRDPGLLEWTGGNLFKARVFPIEAHSEKRIKITYTQVLPLKGNRYRYSYALQSELLKQHPLRELTIDVKVNSVVPLAKVTSPTHTTRTDQTRHSAHVEFSAQEYTPTRDFEVVVEVDGRQSDVVVIPHRRGEDGYFMMLLTPPTGEGDWQREILPDGQPVELLILADTSASLDNDQRTTQGEFIASLLGSLTPEDKFNVAGCDVECDWVFPKAVPANQESIQAARQFLADRVSLGWTDLEKAFGSALKRSGPKTQVIYVGDGIVTGADADPVAFSKSLRRLYQGKAGSLHAVALGSSFEPVVLNTIASLGGGSVRRITGEHGPRTVAVELLGEMAKPSLQDLKVRFKGLRTARVYPQRLPNLPAGSQQILLGRYLPDGDAQAGQVAVTGVRGGQPLRFHTAISLKNAQDGNSFIPRLWARMHLDSLLQQGASSAIKDEIVALSEEYHIMTPYTSFLVLESDEDRERFKVKPRFQMRDGQKFFAEGRDTVDYQLTQQQMQRAGNWRLGLRRAVLRDLLALGRDPRLFQLPQRRYDFEQKPYSNRLGVSGSGARRGARFLMSGPVSAAMPDGSWADFARGQIVDDFEDPFADGLGMPIDESVRNAESWSASELAEQAEPLEEPEFEGADIQALFGGPASLTASLPGVPLEFDADYVSSSPMATSAAARPSRTRAMRLPGKALPEYGFLPVFDRREFDGYRRHQYTQWVDELFPYLPAPPVDKKPKEAKRPWPAPARALAKSLLRTGQLARMQGGLRIERRVESFDVRWGNLTSRSQTLALVSPKAWLIRAGADGSQTTVQWCDDRQRGIFSKAFHLGRVRESTPSDATRPPLGLSGYTLDSIEQTYQDYTVELRPQGEQQVLLALTHPTSPRNEIHVLVDTRRHVICSIEHREDGVVTSTEKYSDFVEAAGAWWATRIETSDNEERRSSLVTQEFKPLAADVLAQQVERQLAGRDRVQLLREPLTKLVDAKRALAAGKATFDDHMALLLHFAVSQQWARVMEHLNELEALAADKPGMRWVRSALLHVSRRREELKKRFLDEAARLAGPRATGKIDSEELFLAEYLRGQAGNVFQANEMLTLLDALQPLYERQPPHLYGTKRCRLARAGYLESAGQSEDALRLRKRLAEEDPRDGSVQRQYAQALARAGEYEAAYAWLQRVLADPQAKWNTYEESSLRTCHADLLRDQGRYAELVDFLAQWIERNPENDSAYRQYLSALIRADREEEANALIARWLKEGRQPEKLPPPLAARLAAAVYQALGQGYRIHADRLDQRWPDPLAETAWFFARHETHSYIADRIMSDWRFRQTDACRGVRKRIVGLLTAEIDKLPAERIQRLVGWIWVNDPAVEAPTWKRIADGLRRRWAAEPKPETKQQLAVPLVQILSGRLSAAEHLAFLRRQREEGPERYRALYANQLFQALLAQPWSAEYEDEAFSLLEGLSDAEEPAERLVAQVSALYRLTDAMVKARFDARMNKVEHQEKLTRTELRSKTEENLQLARQAFADRLHREIPKRAGAIGQWINVERLYLETLLNRNLERVAGDCWEWLGPRPRKLHAEEGPQRLLDEALRHRFLMTLANLAARREAGPELIDRLLKYLDQGIADAPEDAPWKFFKHQLLIALDRPKDLERDLQQWVRSDDPDNCWRRSLGYLSAEQGKIKEAIRLLETVRAADELRPEDYRSLAGFYMAVDRREEHDRALVSVYKTTEEWRLGNWLSRKLDPWRRSDRPLPGELDKDVLLVFSALFEKSGRPQNYIWQLRDFYRATHDFRLLTGVADAVVGHTAARVYPFIGQMQSVLGEVRDEATADSIIEHLAEVRKRAETAVDHRALDLLEVQVKRRCAEVLNQPGPHVEAALAAMQRAFRRQWAPGEPRLMADFLYGLGHIAAAELAAEQLRELNVLHEGAAPGSIDRLHIAHRLAGTLWNAGRCDEAIDLLEAALAEFQEASGGILPVPANDSLDSFVTYLGNRRHYARAEKMLFEQLQHPVNRQQTYWLTERLYQTYVRALAHGGDVTLGTGQALYRAVQRQLRDHLDGVVDHNHRRNLIGELCSLYRTAHDQKISGFADDLRAFAFRQLPGILQRQTTNYQDIVGDVARTLHDVAGLRDGLAFLIERIEQEPVWLRYENQDGWSRHGWYLAEWRQKLKDLGDLEPRLLKIVLAELRWDLRSRQARNRQIYHRDSGTYYWKEKESDFARTAEEVLAERKHSGAAVRYIADYLYDGLHHYDRAIEILFIAHEKKILDEGAQWRLVRFLHWQQRYGESIAVLQGLAELRPDRLEYRVYLMHAYFRTNQPQQLLGLLKQTDEYFHQEGRWTEAAMAGLARSCLDNQLYEQSVAYYEELIPLHQRTHPRRGIGNGTLSDYYGRLSAAYAGLKNTPQAVDAACGAIVSWGRTHENRGRALEHLRQVLRDAPDLDGYVVRLDKQAAETGLHNPIVRKALGRVCFEKQQYARAIEQWKLACQMQPNDAEIHDALIACYDKQQDKQGAVEQVLASLQLLRRDIKRYQDLGRRLGELQQPKEMERAHTSIVEVLPNESESHILLAEIRQGQDRWPEAIAHWRAVAEIRALEPTGLLKLVSAQIHQQQWDAATETLRKLEARSWPERFGDVRTQVRQLEQQIEQGRKR